MQELGHTAVVVIGDFTASIGDPTGRATSRSPLSKTEVAENASRIEAQIRALLNPENLEIRHNADWLSAMPLECFFGMASAFGISKILSRRDFRLRLKAGDRIGLDEVLYPVLQGLDSVAVEADVEIGGSDQRFNMLVGRTIQKRAGRTPQETIEMPLLPSKGGIKMGKSSACISLDLPKDLLRDKLLSIPDELVDTFMEMLTDLEPSAIDDPREKQRALASAVLGQLKT